ncbi:alpha/beta hydrolase [Spiroplasma taiwanense]|uniref:Hydrolase n=1 Tax=Spiroplasma taiwanense CT-1 TaxID=1276220 RepID=S5LWY8_9MOLU|nr:alpha/beta fold hydrolase [Spiroplasma taiwanense]AGR41151.1 hydrolase [Spiroplasma taiwanense CT-1]
MNYEKSLKKIKKYHYNWFNITLTIIFFPIVLLMSWLCVLLFLGYLFKYQRSGKNKHNIELNTYEHLIYDLKVKNIENFNISEEQIKEFNIGLFKEQISALIVRNKNSNKWVIGLHGFKRNKYIGLRNVSHFYEQGYNIITFDAYAHGKTYGTKSDFGWSNSKILNEVINWVKSCYKVEEIGVFGVSMGASSALYFANKYYQNNKIDWMIADCGFAEAVPQIRFFLKKYLKLPWWLMSLGINYNFRRYTQSDIKDVNLLLVNQNIRDLKILFIHGKKDDFIMYHNSIVMHYLKTKIELKPISQIVIYDNAKHSSSMHMNLENYKNTTLSFIK